MTVVPVLIFALFEDILFQAAVADWETHAHILTGAYNPCEADK